MEPSHDPGDVDDGEKRCGGLLIASCDPAKAFEPVKVAFDTIANSVELLVRPALRSPGGVRGDDRLHSLGPDLFAQPVGVVAGIGDARLADRVLQEVLCLRHFVPLAGSQFDVKRPSLGVHDSMNLRGETSTRSTESVLFDPPFPPAASWCARTMVASRIDAISSGSSCTAWKICSQTPRLAQFRNRLYTVFHGPYRRGRSRQGQPVRAMKRTALMKLRSPLRDRRPCFFGSNGRTWFHCSRVSSWRCTPIVDQILDRRATTISAHAPEPIFRPETHSPDQKLPLNGDTP